MAYHNTCGVVIRESEFLSKDKSDKYYIEQLINNQSEYFRFSSLEKAKHFIRNRFQENPSFFKNFILTKQRKPDSLVK